ncbi:MAG: glycosyltransferase family 4 protein [Burkholderiales bacterium]
MNWRSLRIALVGPVPPPAGGMAGQTRQLAELLRAEGAQVTMVPTNPPYRPAWIAHVRGLRALPRLVGYVVSLWRATGRVQMVHLMANSGWSWHLFAAPAIWVARLRGRPVVVNYRGGEAQAFLERSLRWVRPSLRAATALAVPSGFLEHVFARFGIPARVVPNIIDPQRFRPRTGDTSQSDGGRADAPIILVARHLEPIYDIGTAIRAFAIVLQRIPGARLVVAGTGPERTALVRLVEELGIGAMVQFAGQLDREAMAEAFAHADVMVNPSLVDNMPNSVLEAMASGVPVVSTNVGGVPYIVADGHTALLVAPGQPAAMAAAILRLYSEPGLASRLAAAGLGEIQRYTWPQVRDTLGTVYATALAAGGRGFAG